MGGGVEVVVGWWAQGGWVGGDGVGMVGWVVGLGWWCDGGNLMKNLKYEHQSTFPLWGRVKLNFRNRYRKLNILSKN